jgi:FkbM family methyltransferase
MIARSVWRTANLYPGSAFGKIVRLPLRLVPANREIRVLSGPMRGFKWISDSSNATCWMGVYESAKQQAFIEIVKPGDVVFDLGANVGFYTLLASRIAGPSGSVVSFEPSSRNVSYLRRHLQSNAIENCQVIEAAVSSREGSAHFEISALPVTGHITNEPSASGYDVQTVTLDGLTRNAAIPEPNVIKCDVEGGEFEALLGARATLLKSKPVILLATHGAKVHQGCCALLKGLGYRLRGLERRLDLRASDEILAEPI